MRRLAVTRTPVRDRQLKLEWETQIRVHRSLCGNKEIEKLDKYQDLAWEQKILYNSWEPGKKSDVIRDPDKDWNSPDYSIIQTG